MHSTVVQDTKLFAKVSIVFYLPCFTAIFLIYYLINIPRFVNFKGLKEDGDILQYWELFGFYQFSYPFIEVGLMFMALIPFFLLIQSKEYLKLNPEDQKRKFISAVTDKEAPSIYYLFFLSLKNIDIALFIIIFFSGVNKIDFYHIALIPFFVAFTIWPRCFKRSFIILLIYADFFVFVK